MQAQPEEAGEIQLQVHASTELKRLLQTADTDGDKKITIDDLHRDSHRSAQKSQGQSVRTNSSQKQSVQSKGASKSTPNDAHDKTTFWLLDVRKNQFEVSGTYYLSNLLQELKLASDRATDLQRSQQAQQIQSQRIFENPVHRVSRLIRERYWDNLTRRVDADHLAQVLPDSKLPKAAVRNLYVPFGDQEAFDYFEKAAREHPELKMKVWRLPQTLDADRLQELSERHGLLALALDKRPDGTRVGVPFVVPGGRFNEMYGWDSYFESLGLLVDGRRDLAKAMVDNFVYQIQNYGKILNANRSYYLNRSQPPFLTSMILAVYEKSDKSAKGSAETKRWLEASLRAAISEYFNVWMDPDRLTDTGLSRYYGNGRGIPPEVEEGHFDFILQPAARKHKVSVAVLEKRYNAGELKDPELDEFFAHDRAVRESGHDTTYRWRVVSRDRAADFVTVDLNALLYKYELDIAKLIKNEFNDRFVAADGKVTNSREWRERARKRRDLIRRYMWDPEAKMFFDYNFKYKTRSTYVSATAFYPLWAQDPADPGTRILNAAEAGASIRALLTELEAPGGVAATSRASVEKFGDPRFARQWDFPNGWAPHQMMIWEALKSYGHTVDADRLIYKWLYTITRNAADFNGTVPEKFDVVRRSHAVFAEYGNVGTDFSYITQEGFGWMNASYQVGLQNLSPKWKTELQQLRPPEWINFSAP